MKKRMLSNIAVIMIVFILVILVSISENTNINIIDNRVPLSDGRNNSISSIEFVRGMGPGWNLGNSFCCCNDTAYGQKDANYYENLWGNPLTTKVTIDAVKDKGFKTVRIPVTYRNHVDANNQIEEQWLSRLKEVIDYVLEDDMYCIINLHHEDWLIADIDKKEQGEKKLSDIWQQIAEYFKDYDDKLMFESFNEVINSAGQWDFASKESYDVVNSYNQVFVDTVRRTGGNNSSRYLIVKPYAAKATKSVLDGFILPKDSIQNRLIVSTHIYDGIANAGLKIDDLYNRFVSKGIPAIIGEWGNVNGPNNPEEKRIKYAEGILNIATELGIPCIWWDDGGIFKSATEVSNFAILQRKTGQWYFDNLADSIIATSNCTEKQEEQSGEPIDPTDVSSMTNISNWKTGDYSYVHGNYIAESTRICLKGDFRLASNSAYTVNISDSNYHLLVRVIDEEGRLLKSYNLANQDTFTVDSDNYLLRFSIYNYANRNLCYSYKEYADLFNSGFTVSITKGGQ